MRAQLRSVGHRMRGYRFCDRGERDGMGPDLIVLTGCEENMTAAGGSARQPAGESILGLGFGALLGRVSQVKNVKKFLLKILN